MRDVRENIMSALIIFVDLLQPILHFLHICLLVGLIFYIVISLTRHYDLPLALFLGACTTSLVAVGIWFIFGLQTEWKIAIFPNDIRRILYVLVRCLYPLEILLWVSAVFIFAKRNITLTQKQ